MILLQRLLAVLFAVAVVAIGVMLVKARSAAVEADRAIARLRVVQRQIAEIERLDAQTPDWAERRQPAFGQGGLATAVNDVLAAAGVPASSLSSLSPAAEAPVTLGSAGGAGGAGSAAFRRRAVLTLAPVTLPQVGVVLKTWRDAHPDWVIATIDLTPEPQGRREPSPGSDLPLRAVFGLETLYVSTSDSSTGSGALR